MNLTVLEVLMRDSNTTTKWMRIMKLSWITPRSTVSCTQGRHPSILCHRVALTVNLDNIPVLADTAESMRERF